MLQRTLGGLTPTVHIQGAITDAETSNYEKCRSAAVTAMSDLLNQWISADERTAA